LGVKLTWAEDAGQGLKRSSVDNLVALWPGSRTGLTGLGTPLA